MDESSSDEGSSGSSYEDSTDHVWQPPGGSSVQTEPEENPEMGENDDSELVKAVSEAGTEEKRTPPPVPKKTFRPIVTSEHTPDSKENVALGVDECRPRISVRERAQSFEKQGLNQNPMAEKQGPNQNPMISSNNTKPEVSNISPSRTQHGNDDPQGTTDNLQANPHQTQAESPNIQMTQMTPEGQPKDEPSHTPRLQYPGQYPGPRSAHGWYCYPDSEGYRPGTPPAPNSQNLYRPRQPQYQSRPPYNMGTPPTAGPRPPTQLEQIPPGQTPTNMPPHPPYGYPYPYYPQQRMPFIQPRPGNNQFTPGPGIRPYGPQPQPQTPSLPHETQPKTTTPEDTKPKGPGKQVPQRKEGHSEKKKLRQEPSSSPRSSGKKTLERKNKAHTAKDSPQEKGDKGDSAKTTPTKKGPEKCYLCVDGIDEEHSNDTVINYLEARSKMEIILDESLRTEDNSQHAIVVFEDQIDEKKLQSDCKKKNLGSSSLEFEKIDPPRMLIASSEDRDFTKEMFEEFLKNKKKQQVVRVSTTDDGAVFAKLKLASGVSEVLKDPNVKISGCKVTISMMYNCDHGTFYDKSLHTVSIPVPFMPTVTDSHIKSFLIDIQSVCNEHLEQHHAKLVLTDELHIECIIQPQDRDARRKVKDWKESVQTAWEQFVKANAQKRELQISSEMKELMIEHVNKVKQVHKTEVLKVISPDETGSMKFVFVGQTTVVENFHEQISTKKAEIEEQQKRINSMKTEVMDVKPLEVALMKKENKFGELSGIADDFTYDADEENGGITFTGVEEDISKAKVKVYEIKNNYQNFNIDSLSRNQFKLLGNPEVMKLVEEELSTQNIQAVFAVKVDDVMVCSTHDDRRKIENVFKGLVTEDSITLDATSKIVLNQDEWFDKKNELENTFQNVIIIDASAGDRIVVTATKDTLDLVVGDLEDFIKEHSIYEDTVKISDNSIFKFLKLHREDWFKQLIMDNNDQNLDINYDQNPIKVKGTKTAIDTAKSEIKKECSKIKSDNHSISKPGIDLLFNNDTKAKEIINPVEEDSRTVITVNQSPGRQQGFNRRSAPKQSDEEYANNQAFKNYRRDTKKPKKGGGGGGDRALKSGPVVCSNKTTITLVRKGDISLQKADVIVCSTNGQLDMSGPAGKSLVRGAGTQLLDDIKNNYSDGINHGDIAVLKGYSLKCQEVYLAALPSWSPGGEKYITKCVDACLKQAASYSSIVLPAFGTGNFHYPRNLVARKMYECVSQFDGQNTSLKDVKFLVYDDETIKAFEQEELAQLNPGFQPQPQMYFPTGGSGGHYKKNNLTVKLKKGDLGTQKLQVLVSAVPKELNLESAGGAGKSLLQGLGQGVQQDIANQHPLGIASGGFADVKLSAPSGPCKHVFLTSLEPWSSEKKIPKDEDKQICKFVYQCLETAEKIGCTSIGIPAMGTGNIGYPHNLVASYMYQMVEKFANNHKQSKLKDVRFILHQKDTKTIKAFEDEEKKWAPQVKAAQPKFAAADVGSQDEKVVPKPINDHEFKVGDLKLTVEQGDILSKTCDAIVNGCSDDLDLSKGAVSKAIRSKCNAKQLDDECAKKRDDMKKYGVVRTTACGLSNCKAIIHMATKSSPYGWKKVIKDTLKKAEKNQYSSIAFPALGTEDIQDEEGAAGSSEEQMGQTIMEALVEFVTEKNPTNLQQVYLIIFQDKMFKNMLKGVRSGGQSAVSKGPQKVVKSKDTNKSSVDFIIYYSSWDEFSEAKKLLDKAISRKYTTEKVRDSILTEAKDSEIEFLMKIEDNYSISLTIDAPRGEVTLDGVLEEVMSAKQEVFDALRKFSHARHCKAEAAIIQEQVQWYLKDIGANGLPELIPYPDMVNMYLETAYKGESGRTEVEFNDASGEEYVIVLKEMTEYLKKDRNNKVDVIRREKLQGGAGNTEAPPEWDDQGTESVKVVTLVNTSPEYKSVEKKFIDSVFSGRKEWATQFNKQTLKVTKIERIQNLNLWRMYGAKKDLIEKQNPSGTKNEQELWHGTPEAAVVSINFYGFNRSYCRGNSKDAYWGEGVYFSADASYSARPWLAAGTGVNAHAGEHNIYLCKVLTGVTIKGQRGMRFLPMRQDGTMLNYDSATDAQYTPVVEYVIFNDTQAYPQYRIKFTY